MSDTLFFDSIRYEIICIPFKEPFKTSKGLLQDRKLLVLEASSGSIRVRSECAVFENSFYFGYDMLTCKHIFDSLIPTLCKQHFTTPYKAFIAISQLTDNTCVQAALDTLFWQLLAKQNKKSLTHVLGSSIKAQPIVYPLGLDAHLGTLKRLMDQGYTRFKIKINSQGLNYWSKQCIPKTIKIMLDANGSLDETDVDTIVNLESESICLIEQPFLAEKTSLYNAVKVAKTAMYFDESIGSYHQALQLLEDFPSFHLTLKPSRVGGISPCLNLLSKKVSIRFGGMFESDMGREVLYALSTLSPALSDGGPVDLYLQTTSNAIYKNKSHYYYR